MSKLNDGFLGKKNTSPKLIATNGLLREAFDIEDYPTGELNQDAIQENVRLINEYIAMWSVKGANLANRNISDAKSNAQMHLRTLAGHLMRGEENQSIERCLEKLSELFPVKEDEIDSFGAEIRAQIDHLQGKSAALNVAPVSLVPAGSAAEAPALSPIDLGDKFRAPLASDTPVIGVKPPAPEQVPAKRRPALLIVGVAVVAAVTGAFALFTAQFTEKKKTEPKKPEPAPVAEVVKAPEKKVEAPKPEEPKKEAEVKATFGTPLNLSGENSKPDAEIKAIYRFNYEQAKSKLLQLDFNNQNNLESIKAVYKRLAEIVVEKSDDYIKAFDLLNEVPNARGANFFVLENGSLFPEGVDGSEKPQLILLEKIKSANNIDPILLFCNNLLFDLKDKGLVIRRFEITDIKKPADEILPSNEAQRFLDNFQARNSRALAALAEFVQHFQVEPSLRDKNIEPLTENDVKQLNKIKDLLEKSLTPYDGKYLNTKVFAAEGSVVVILDANNNENTFKLADVLSNKANLKILNDGNFTRLRLAAIASSYGELAAKIGQMSSGLKEPEVIYIKEFIATNLGDYAAQKFEESVNKSKQEAKKTGSNSEPKSWVDVVSYDANTIQSIAI